MRLRATVASAVILLVGGAVTATSGMAQAATSPRASVTGWTVEGAAGSQLLPSGYREFTGTAASTFVDAHRLVMDGQGGWQVDLEPSSTSELQVGTFATNDFGSGDSLKLSISGERGGCLETGTLQIHEVLRDPTTQVITSLAASYSLVCAGTTAANVGEIRYGSTVDYARFGAAPLGTSPAPQTVTVTAATTTTFGTAVVEGLDADQWSIATDSCSGKKISAGDSCLVTLASRPTHEGGLVARLRLPSTRGDRMVGLTSVGVNTADGTFTSLPPVRLLDTRSALGAPRGAIGSGQEIDVTIAGRAGVPLDVASSVVLNVTVVSPTLPGYLTLFPAGTPRPDASSVNFPARWTGANLVTVPLGANGHLRVFNAVGATNVVADVVGYYSSATSTADPAAAHLADYLSVEPFRLIDTRTDGGGPVPANYYLVQGVDYGAEFNDRIVAFAVNVTVVGPGAAGYLRTWDGVSRQPITSTLNFLRGQVVANMATIRVGRCSSECNSTVPIPSIGILNASSASSHVLVDVVGIYFEGVEGDRGWRYHSLPSPTRFVDSRKALGLATPVGPRSSQAVEAPSTVAGYNTYAIVSNVTAVHPTAPTYLTLWRNDTSPVPPVSNVNAGPGQVVANMAITEVWTRNDLRVYNSAGSTEVLVDAAGTMEYYPARVPPAAPAAGGSDGSVAPRGAVTRPDAASVRVSTRVPTRVPATVVHAP